MRLRASTIQSESHRIALNRAVWSSFLEPDSDVRDPAKRILAPTLMIFGTMDPAISAIRDGREAVRSIAHARLVTMRCGHAPFAELPAEFASVVTAFLSEV